MKLLNFTLVLVFWFTLIASIGFSLYMGVYFGSKLLPITSEVTYVVTPEQV